MPHFHLKELTFSYLTTLGTQLTFHGATRYLLSGVRHSGLSPTWTRWAVGVSLVDEEASPNTALSVGRASRQSGHHEGSPEAKKTTYCGVLELASSVGGDEVGMSGIVKLRGVSERLVLVRLVYQLQCEILTC